MSCGKLSTQFAHAYTGRNLSPSLVTLSERRGNGQKIILFVRVCSYPFYVCFLSGESAPNPAKSVDVRFVRWEVNFEHVQIFST